MFTDVIDRYMMYLIERKGVTENLNEAKSPEDREMLQKWHSELGEIIRKMNEKIECFITDFLETFPELMKGNTVYIAIAKVREGGLTPSF